MAISYVNTAELENISKDINLLANELNTEFNNLFLRFSEVPTVTKEWVGDKAKFYFNHVYAEKKQYMDFISKLREIGNKISKDSYEIQLCINKNSNEEKKKDY